MVALFAVSRKGFCVLFFQRRFYVIYRFSRGVFEPYFLKGREWDMIKKVPNILSTLRIVGSLSLLLFAWGIRAFDGGVMSFLFIVVYTFCGVSDILDGLIARRYDATSKIGAKLDTFGDILLFFSAFVSVLVIIKLRLETAPLVWILVAVATVGFNVVFTKIKFGQFNGVHTILRKLGGGSTFFIVPISIAAYEIKGNQVIFAPIVIAVSVILIVSAIEEFIILLTSTEFDPDRPSIFAKSKKPAEKDGNEKTTAEKDENADGVEYNGSIDAEQDEKEVINLGDADEIQEK
jgi:CDP-diacylglycerol--glycerol-3-phosphate 3-phosphatidyltransferase